LLNILVSIQAHFLCYKKDYMLNQIMQNQSNYKVIEANKFSIGLFVIEHFLF